MSKVYLLDNEGERKELGTWSVSPKEALICAINQFLYNNYHTWMYHHNKWNPDTRQYIENHYEGIKETPRLFVYCFGRNSTLFVYKEGVAC